MPVRPSRPSHERARFAKPKAPGLGITWRFVGSYKLGYKSPNMGYKYSYPTHSPSYNYP